MDNMINRREIKNVIEKRLCPEHQEHPTVEITQQGINLSTCCEPFKQALTSQIKDLSKEHAKNYALQQFQNMFRR